MCRLKGTRIQFDIDSVQKPCYFFCFGLRAALAIGTKPTCVSDYYIFLVEIAVHEVVATNYTDFGDVP